MGDNLFIKNKFCPADCLPNVSIIKVVISTRANIRKRIVIATGELCKRACCFLNFHKFTNTSPHFFQLQQIVKQRGA